MLKAIAWLIKASAFAVIVLIVGNYFKIGQKTVSDQIKTQLSHAEKIDVLDEVKDWAHQVTTDHKNGILKKSKAEHGVHTSANLLASPGIVKSARPAAPSVATNNAGLNEEIPSSERQKLRALMRELNSARDAN